MSVYCYGQDITHLKVKGSSKYNDNLNGLNDLKKYVEVIEFLVMNK